MNIQRSTVRRAAFAGAFVLAALVLVAAVLVGFRQQAQASSHREAPLISKDPFADNTDTYVFISPENQNNVVLVASWIPFEGPEGGPNYYEWDDNALYDIYVDNDGDATADYTYTLSSKVQVANPNTFLYNVGAITSLGDPDWNRKQFISVTETSETGSVVLVGNKPTAPVNIGEKSTGNYAALEQEAIYDAADGVPSGIKVFAGQTDDPFFVDLQVFDLLTLRGQQPPVGYLQTNIPVDSVSAYNVHSLVVEVPISHLKQGSEPVLGVWAATRRPTLTVLAAGAEDAQAAGYAQISRLGMPLVNEVVIPMGVKDAFNTLRPEQDLTLYTGGAGVQLQKILQKSVEDPEIGNLLCALYGVPLPGDANDDCKTEIIARHSPVGARRHLRHLPDGHQAGQPVHHHHEERRRRPAGRLQRQPTDRRAPGRDDPHQHGHQGQHLCASPEPAGRAGRRRLRLPQRAPAGR